MKALRTLALLTLGLFCHISSAQIPGNGVGAEFGISPDYRDNGEKPIPLFKVQKTKLVYPAKDEFTPLTAANLDVLEKAMGQAKTARLYSYPNCLAVQATNLAEGECVLLRLRNDGMVECLGVLVHTLK